jgi:hypothetical protein
METRTSRQGAGNSPPRGPFTHESRFRQILLIPQIAEMQGGFANTLVIRRGVDNSGRIREAKGNREPETSPLCMV